MNKHGLGLLKLILALTLGVVVLSAMLDLMDTLLTRDHGQNLVYQNRTYPVSPSTSEGLQAVRYHHALMGMRQQADMVYVFGGRAHVAREGGEWWGHSQWPLRRDYPWNELQSRMMGEGNQDWFRRLAGMGGTRFFEEPYPLLAYEDYEMDTDLEGFTILFLRGRVLLAVAQVRGWKSEEGELAGWEMWESHLVDTQDFREWSYCCSWRQDEVQGGDDEPDEAIPGEGRQPGAREFQVPMGVTPGSRLAFSEVIFPDPLWQWANSPDGEPMLPRYAYQFFFR